MIMKYRVEVLAEVVLKSSIFWDIPLCSPLKVNRRFGGTCCLIRGALSKQTGCYLPHAGFLFGLFFDSEEAAGAMLATCFILICFLGLSFNPEDGDDIYLRNVS
jgi:hypothetical protein